MGLNDTVQQLILVKADTAEARADLQKLRGVERQAAKERLAEINAHNKGIDDQIAGWVKAAAAVGAVYGAIKVLQKAAKAYLEVVRLESGAAGINVDRLRDATMGLVETDNLLAFAGKTKAGMWKLNQQEMETVLKGATALRKTMGVELLPTIETLTEAIGKGNTGALKEFGIEAKDKSGVLDELREKYNSLGGDASLAGDDIERSGVKMSDAMDDLTGALGRFAVALTPIVEMLADIAESLVNAATAPLQSVLNNPAVQQQIELQKEIDRLAKEAQATLEIPDATLFAKWDDQKRQAMKAMLSLIGMGANPIRGRSGRRSSDSGFDVEYDRSQRLELRPDNTLTGLGGDLGGAGAIDSLGMRPAGVEAAMEERAKRMLEMQEAAERKQNIMQSIFGTPEAIDATAIAVYGAAQAFQLLEQAATAALDAFITGQMSMAQAVKAAIAQGLKAIAIDASIQALKNTAYGVAALATGPIGGVSAGGFFKAAALFAGVAVAATAGAKAAYNAGWGGPTGASTGGGYSSGGGGYLGSSNGGGSGGTTSTVIYVTGDAYRMSQAEREHRISDAARRGSQKRSSNVVAHS